MNINNRTEEECLSHMRMIDNSIIELQKQIDSLWDIRTDYTTQYNKLVDERKNNQRNLKRRYENEHGTFTLTTS